MRLLAESIRHIALTLCGLRQATRGHGLSKMSQLRGCCVVVTMVTIMVIMVKKMWL